MIVLFNVFVIMFTPLVKKIKSVLSSQSSETETNIIKPKYEQESGERSKQIEETIYDCIKTIRDPEKPASLEDLNVVYEEGVTAHWVKSSQYYTVNIEFNPTVPHCSLATLIGLCIRVKLERLKLLDRLKITIKLKSGSHDTEEEINKQINDKERVAAAMENPSLADTVDKCIKEID